MAHQSALAAEGADEHDQYWELVWANLVRYVVFSCFSVFKNWKMHLYYTHRKQEFIYRRQNKFTHALLVKNYLVNTVLSGARM